jgi:membrane protease YdiL (CAAX protease family)
MKADVLTDPRPETFEPVAAPWHTAVVLAAIGLLVFRGRIQAEQMRAAINPDRIALYERILLTEWLSLALVLAGVWLKGVSLLTVLGDHWRSAREFLRDAGIGVLFLIASVAISSIFGAHGGPTDRATNFLLPQGGLQIGLWILISITAGICEEAIYRGYLQKQFTALTRNVPAGILISALLFGLGHSYQGWRRASVISLMGAMAGILAYWRRSVRPGMLGHALQDLLGAFVRH